MQLRKDWTGSYPPKGPKTHLVRQGAPLVNF